MEIIKENWQLILSSFIALVSLIAMFIRKPADSSLMESIHIKVVEALPKLINLVEVDGEGKLKKAKVVSLALSMYEKALKRNLSSDEIEIISDVISKDIEEILSTPTKKGE